MKILFFTILIFQTWIGVAQYIEITVLNKKSIPMPYAFILINGKPITVSDTLGHSMIPINKLKDNDTISVSYLGASPAVIIYNKALYESKKHTFYLDESDYKLNEVVVTYQDNEKLLRKNTKKIPALNYNCTIDARFSAKLCQTGQSAYQVFGTLEAANDRSIKYKYWFWFDPPIKFNTKNDTTGIGRYLDPVTHMILFFVNQSLYISQVEYKIMKKPFYSYLGEKDNCKIFRITFPPGYFTEYYYQIILYVDKNTQYIQKVEADAYNDKSGKDHYSFKFNLKFDCKLFTQKNPKMNTIYLPENIQFTYQVIDKLKFDYYMSEVTIK
jgi:hypothetical protein